MPHETATARDPLTGFEAGTVLQGTYRLETLIGRGGMGSVWAAQHLRLPKQVAVKVLHRLPEGVAFARFRREAEIAARLHHTNIVEVIDFNVHEGGVPYLVMPLLRGRSLRDRLDIGSLDLAETFTVIRQLGSGLAAAHAMSVIHRDLKPANVFLCAPSGAEAAETVRILDFGTSKILDSTTIQTAEAAMIGTPQYMAPEQAAGRNDLVGAHTDQFALALVAYELLSGVPAFGGGHPASVIYRIVHEAAPALAGVPDHVAAAVERALSKRPADRYPDVLDFVEAFTGQSIARAAPAQVAALSADVYAATLATDESSPSIRPEVAAGIADTLASDERPLPLDARETQPPLVAAPPATQPIANRSHTGAGWLGAGLVVLIAVGAT